MRRISAEEVTTAYVRTGLLPAACIWISDKFACALGAVAVYNGADATYDGIMDWISDALYSKYVGGFIAGFDGLTLESHWHTSEGFQGYEDGLAAAGAVFADKKVGK